MGGWPEHFKKTDNDILTRHATPGASRGVISPCVFIQKARHAANRTLTAIKFVVSATQPAAPGTLVTIITPVVLLITKFAAGRAFAPIPFVGAGFGSGSTALRTLRAILAPVVLLITKLAADRAFATLPFVSVGSGGVAAKA